MKLFYDNLLPFMPDSKLVEGNRVPDEKLQTVRQIMIYLSDFQNDRNLMALYEAVNQFSLYADINVIDLILSLGDVEVPSLTIEDSLDFVATSLAKSYLPDNTIDVKVCTAILLSVAHMVMQINRQIVKESAGASNEIKDDEVAEDTSDE